MPAVSAASSLVIPCAIPNQNRWSSDRPATGGRPGDGNGAHQTGVIFAFEWPSQPPSLRCCDDRLNPPMCPKNTQSGWRKQASSLPSEPSEIVTALRQHSRRNDQRSLQGRGQSLPRTAAQLRSRGVRYSRMGGLVQPPTLLEPIGHIPSAEAEEQYYAMLDEPLMAGQLKPEGPRQTRPGSVCRVLDTRHC